MFGLDSKLEEWRRAGLLSPTDIESIEAYEAAQSTGIAVWQEVLGYLGGTLALSAGAVLLGEYWDQLTVVAQLSLFGVLALVLTVIGYLVPADREAALRRFSSVLLAGGTLATGWVVGFGLTELTSWSDEAVGLAAGLAVLAHGLVTWRTRVAPLQQIASYGGLWAVIVSGAILLEVRPEPLLGGLLIAAVGLIWGLLTWGEVVRPRMTGYLLSGAGLAAGLQVASVEDPRLVALGLAVVVALLVLVAGARLGEQVLVGLGAAGILVFVPQLIFELFADTVGAPVALLVTGVALVGGAVASIRLGRRALEAEQPAAGAPADDDGTATGDDDATATSEGPA